MKWSNPGCEFEAESKTLIKQYEPKKFYIFGAGLVGMRVLRAIETITGKCVEGFFDSSPDKQETYYLGKQIFSKKMAGNIDKENSIIVIAIDDTVGEKVQQELIDDYGWQQNNCLTYGQFIRHDFPIIAMYQYGKVFIDTVSMLVTEKCTLKCKKCAIMLPYFPASRHYNIEELKKYTDLLFSKADFVGDFTLTGGEPTMWAHLSDLIDYIASNYSDQYGDMKIISNGTLKPEEALIETMKKYNVAIEISDYGNSIPEIHNKVIETVTIYRENGIRTYFLSMMEWVDFGFETVNHDEWHQMESEAFFDYCHTRCRGYIDGELCYCINARLAEKALEKSIDLSNRFALNKIGNTFLERCKLIEFDMGFNDRGYLDMCRHCNGTCEINTNYIKAGEQCTEKLFQL